MAKLQSRWMTSLRKWLLLFVLVTMIGWMPILGNFLGNRFEVSLQAMVLPLVGVMVIAAVVASVFYRYYRRNQLGGFLATILAAILLTNNYDARLSAIYPIITAFLPLPQLGGIEASIFSLIFIVVIFVLVWGASRLISAWVKQRGWAAKDLVGGASLAVAITFLLLFVPSLKTVIGAWSQYFYKPPTLATNGANTAAGKPDIYYIVMEDYASQSQLKDQFNFNDTDFTNYLTGNGYYTNPDAHQNYPYTTMSIASTLNAGYDADIINKYKDATSQTIVPYHRAIQYSSVVSTLKNLGYSYDEIGTWYETTNRGPLADNFYLNDRRLTLFGHLTYIDGFTQSQMSESLFWRFLENGVSLGRFTLGHYQGEGQVQLTGDALGTLKNLVDQPAGGRFIFAHLIIPHEPYYFNADGSINSDSGSDDNGETIKQKYVNQVQYINDQMKQILSSIKTNSGGKAIVVLQSDEGPHPQELDEHIYDEDSANDEINNQNMALLSNSDLALKYGDQAAYYLPGISATEATGANNLDIFRLVLDHYFGANMSILPECYYAYPNGRNQPFVYEDITDRLTGLKNPVCAADGTGSK